MRAVLLILPLIVLGLALPAVAGQDTEPAEPAETNTETPAEPAAEPARQEAPSAWEQWVNTRAYDPVIRRWVPIPEGVTPGPKSGYIWNLGRWEVVKIIHRRDYGWGYFDHRGRWHGQDERRPVYREVLWKRRDYLDTVPKDTFDQPYLVRTLKLDPLERGRLEDLLERNLLQELMLDDPGEQEAVVSYERRRSKASISGRAELVAKLATLITDESTYKAVTTGQPHGNVVAIISLVDLRWLDNDPEPALNIADLNFSGLLRLVRAGDDEHRRHHRALWFNDTFGTVTIIDQPDTIRKVREFLGVMPYAAKPTRMTTTAPR